MVESKTKNRGRELKEKWKRDFYVNGYVRSRVMLVMYVDVQIQGKGVEGGRMQSIWSGVVWVELL